MKLLLLSLVFNLITLKTSVTKNIQKCNKTIELHYETECIYNNYGNRFQSIIFVHLNSSGSIFDSKIYEQSKIQRIQNESIFLRSVPIFLTKTRRYKASLCLEILYQDLAKLDSIWMKFSTRKLKEGIPIHRSEVIIKIVSVDFNDKRSFINIGCYWHYEILIAHSVWTVNLEVGFLAKNGSTAYGKYYFRIPNWERFNSHEGIVDPCSFDPFVYVIKTEDSEMDHIVVRPINCSNRISVVEQWSESLLELISSGFYPIRSNGINHFSFKSSNLAHFYRVNITHIKVSDLVAARFIFLPIIAISILLISLVIFYVKFIMKLKKTIIFLKRKPNVKFLYRKSFNFEMYQKQAEILISFMEEYCDITVHNGWQWYQGEPVSSLLLRESFDILVLIPFPGAEARNDDDMTKIIKRMKVDIVIIELPFWNKGVDNLYCSNKNWKRFKMMDEFVPFIRYLHRRRSCFQKISRCPLTTQQIQEKLEEYNLTNDGFLFCLEAISENHQISYKLTTDHSFPNLQEMNL